MVSKLLCPSRAPDSRGLIQRVTPQSAGWRYVGFEVYQLTAGQTLAEKTGDTEVCLVFIGGKGSVKTDDARFDDVGARLSPFERTPPYSVYIPAKNSFEVTAATDLELAVCKAPGKGLHPSRLIPPDQVMVENRGKGQNSRYVQTILSDDSVAESLLVVEVFTDQGNTSSWPSHKHDQDNPPTETYLEETYYHRFNPPQGFCFQRVYTDDRSLDESMAVYDRDVVLVPRGYHPVATVAGYDNYYLNVMAGPTKRWIFTWEKDHAWINSEQYR
ncbi:MAG: 5-deoxy-glucuronate isomerase [Methylobacteriaceae bacterium]|jgi:5-deoxy-glucuronate isomerase|nr:5-deoxy-glucuronate isomerase [Methylobacteriaceae bacterium]